MEFNWNLTNTNFKLYINEMDPFENKLQKLESNENLQIMLSSTLYIKTNYADNIHS